MLILQAFLILLGLFILGVCIAPVETKSLKNFYKKSYTYEQSIAFIEEKVANDPDNVAEYGHAILLTHGEKKEKAVVFYHGYTNCPRQYEQLAQMYFERGYNVYVPRVPYNGVGDLCTKEIGKITIEDIKQVCDESIDVALGLGEKVTVIGLSMGGVMSAYNAQFRDDVENVIIIVPSFGWYFLPGIIKPLVNLSFLLPNMFIWWDPIKKTNRDCPYSMYHHFSSWGMGHILRFGLAVLRAAKKNAPLAEKITVMTNELDIAVDNLSNKKLIKWWQKKRPDIQWYQFSKDLQMEHDIIDPLHPYAKPDLVYNKILEYTE